MLQTASVKLNSSPNNANAYTKELGRFAASSALLGASLQSAICLTSGLKSGALKNDIYIKSSAKSVGKAAAYSALLSVGVSLISLGYNKIKNKVVQNKS